MLEDKELTVDDVDESLDCIRLQWTRNAGIPERLGLLQVDAMRGKVHIIRFHVVVGVLLPSDHREDELIGVGEAKPCFISEFFYMNKCFVDKIEMYNLDEKGRIEH